MNAELTVPSVGLFLLVAFPGLISARVYRLIMPAREMEWGHAVLEGLFYSAVNFALGLPVLWWLVLGHDPLADTGRYVVAAVLVLLVGPIIWPFVLVALFKSKAVTKRIQVPYPTAWDWFFDKRQPVFALVHLAGGDVVGAYWGGESYAGSFPNDGDIYFEGVYAVDSAGRFGDPVPNTRGVLLRKDQYSYIELFDVPAEEDAK